MIATQSQQLSELGIMGTTLSENLETQHLR